VVVGERSSDGEGDQVVAPSTALAGSRQYQKEFCNEDHFTTRPRSVVSASYSAVLAEASPAFGDIVAPVDLA
jgi:hypothetical protein